MAGITEEERASIGKVMALWESKLAGVSPEAQASMGAEMTKVMSAEERKVEEDKFRQLFDECDANKDGRCDLEEMKVMSAKQQEESMTKHGAKLDFTDDDLAMCYAEYNKLSEGDGVTHDDFIKIGKIFEVLGAEMAAKQAQ